jgi:hypothetical protein
MEKKSLLLIDDNRLKVVYGDKMRCIAFPDLSLEHNAEFLAKIFRTTKVFKVDQVSPVDSGQLEGLLDREKDAASPASQPPPKARAVPSPPQEAQRTTSTDQGSNWVASNTKTTIIVDDLFTGNTVSRGGASVPQTVALHPGKPFDLSTLKEDLVNASKILPRLLAKGWVSRVSFDDAMGMLDAYEKGQGQVISALDSQAKGVVAASGSKAADLVDSMFDDDGDSAENAIPIEITEKDHRGSASNEDSGSMGQLMEMLSSAEANGELEGKGTVKKARI